MVCEAHQKGSQFCCSQAAVNQSLKQVWMEDYHVFIRDIIIPKQYALFWFNKIPLTLLKKKKQRESEKTNKID